MTRPRLTVVSSDVVSSAPPAALPRRQGATRAGQKSFANLVEAGGAGAFMQDGRGAFDPARMRADFPDIWARYLRANFGSAERVAVAFGVTFQCACNWLNGTSRPTGDKVAMVALTDPAGLARATAAQRRAA